MPNEQTARTSPEMTALLERPAGVSDAMASLRSARAATDDLFAIVRAGAIHDRPIAERHRIVFYIGHLEAFDWNLFSANLFDASSIDPALDRLFAFGIDPIGGGLPTDSASDWPSLDAVSTYCRRTRETIDHQIDRLGALSASGRDVDQIINVAIEHRLMHAETLAYMFHRLPLASKHAGPPPDDPPFPPPAHGAVAIPAGMATLGRKQGFGWDNEFAEHAVEVPAFRIDRYKVTNGLYRAFVEAGGYADRSLWAPQDWQWRTEAGLEHPGFWLERDGAWWLRGMFGERPLPEHWPVFVSQAEASAYARWRGKTLPTEAQFHRAAFGRADGGENAYPWGNEPPTHRHGNFDFQRWDPSPVTAHPAGDSAFGVSGLLGNGWEWTSTLFAPFDGFSAFPFYPGYSADFFDGKHFVLKGGSMRTAAPLLRRSFRNWFQAHYTHVYAGFRCVTG